jgi:hypothetical protein
MGLPTKVMGALDPTFYIWDIMLNKYHGIQWGI